MKLLAIFMVGVWFAGVVAAGGVRKVEDEIQPGEYIHGEAALATRLNLGAGFSLVKEQSRPTSYGLLRNRLRIYYNGVPVRAMSIQASATTNGIYTGAASGYLPMFSSIDTSPTVSESDLRDMVVNYLNTENPNPKGLTTASELVNFDYKKQIYINDNGDERLVYNIKSLVDKDEYIRTPRVLYDIADSAIIGGYVYLRFASGNCPNVIGGNPKWGDVIYGPNAGAGELCLNAKKKGHTCYYENKFVKVYSCKFSWFRGDAELVSFPCDDGPDDASNEANSPSSDAFYFAQRYEDMMNELGGVAQTTEVGRPHIIYVDYGDNYNNAFWDGYYSTFGSGNGKNYPFTVPEAIAHEMCHAFTDYLGNCNFHQESIVMDEVFSDICGKTLSFFTNALQDWRFAKNLRKDPADALRWFDDPPHNPYFVDNINDVPVDEPFKAMGVFGKFYYLLITDLGLPYKVAFELFVHANVMYWQEDTSFAEAACGLLMAASDYGIDTDAVEDIWNTLGYANMNFCDLSGTLDVITEQHKQRTNVLVSNIKKPSFSVEIPAGSSGVKVKVTQNNGVDVSMTLGTSSGTNEVTFQGSGTQTLSLSTAQTDVIGVKIKAKFL